ncbi:MAG: CPBP family intramembrane metalloprotease [Lachnospiraceae bacterium]|nr:CPBP family intramembrane metalloprotease [Lachnospiraceae bacterium]
MDKKLETKRLWVYLAFAFGLTWIIFFAYIFSGNTWAANGEISGMEQFVSLGMLCPALSVLLARYVTKEGFAVTGEGSMLLGISFKDKKWIYFVIAMLLPWILFELGNGLTLLLSPGAFDADYPAFLGIADHEQAIICMQPIAMMITSSLVSFCAFGEEAGWRGYMMPKMVKLWGLKKAVLIGGIIWGIWHWPLTCIGHNFGRDYWGYPFTGFAAMCVMCISSGMILTFVTYKSGSIWPAAILHAINNSSPSILQYYINKEKMTGWRADSIGSFFIFLLPELIIAACLYARLRRELAAGKELFTPGQEK